MGGGAPSKAVALHDTGETFALGDAGDVHQIANGEDSSIDLLSDLVRRYVIDGYLL